VEQSSISGNDTLPMNSGRNYSLFTITGRPADATHQTVADIAVVDTRYFETMEVPLVSGRNFTELDTYKTRLSRSSIKNSRGNIGRIPILWGRS